MAIGSITNMHYKLIRYFVAKTCKAESKTNPPRELTLITLPTAYQVAVSLNTNLIMLHCIAVLRLHYSLKKLSMEIIDLRILRSITMKTLVCWVLTWITSCEE
jgi:hypothetical protein